VHKIAQKVHLFEHFHPLLIIECAKKRKKRKKPDIPFLPLNSLLPNNLTPNVTVFPKNQVSKRTPQNPHLKPKNKDHSQKFRKNSPISYSHPHFSLKNQYRSPAILA